MSGITAQDYHQRVNALLERAERFQQQLETVHATLYGPTESVAQTSPNVSMDTPINQSNMAYDIDGLLNEAMNPTTNTTQTPDIDMNFDLADDFDLDALLDEVTNGVTEQQLL